jgi:hypothetical protein
MPAVRALEQVGAQLQGTTSGQLPEHPQLVLTQLKQRQHDREKRAQDVAQRPSVVGGLPAALRHGTERVHSRRLGAEWEGDRLPPVSARGGWCR